MTRFLSRISNDPLCGSFNRQTERLFDYHQATKHTYQSVRTNAHFLDWKNQPDPFRSYEGATTINLSRDPGLPDMGTFAAIGALAHRSAGSGNEPELPSNITLDQNWLSSLLWHSMAISAWKKVPGTGNRYSLRVNPSSGNLHPTETYLALRGVRDTADGLYHYRADSHALELRRSGAAVHDIARALIIPWAAEAQLIVALTSIFWREAWKYRDRAYRYCCHDMGHAMMSLLLAARALGLSGGAIAHFGDARLAHELGLTGSNCVGGDEAPMAFLVFPSKSNSEHISLPHEKGFAGVANELSPQEVPCERLLEIHRATILPDSVGPSSTMVPASTAIAGEDPPAATAPGAPTIDAALGHVVRRRRSALDFDPRTPPMDREHMVQLLDFATRDWSADWRGNFHGSAVEFRQGADFVSLFLYAHRVAGCDPGVYRWDKTASRLEQLHQAKVERVAAYLSLEQALAGNACFAVSMIADLAKAAQTFGNRGYRYVHFEAGAIGQRLYVGAEALNWNATGIGAFYDDDVHRYLGFLEERDTSLDAALNAAERRSLVMLDSPASRHATVKDLEPAERPVVFPGGEAALPQDSRMLPQQAIYHFAVGRAVPDPRLEG